MKTNLSPELIRQVQRELDRLDLNPVSVDGVEMKPSQCYHFGVSPAHVLFNTNCPDQLKQQVQAILSKYTDGDEGGSPQ